MNTCPASKSAVTGGSPATASAAHVETMLRRHAYPAFGDRPIGTIRPSEIQAWVKGSPLAPSTVHVLHGVVSAIFRAAVRDRIIPSSPCEQTQAPPQDQTQSGAPPRRGGHRTRQRGAPALSGAGGAGRRHRPTARRNIRAHSRPSELPQTLPNRGPSTPRPGKRTAPVWSAQDSGQRAHRAVARCGGGGSRRALTGVRYRPGGVAVCR